MSKLEIHNLTKIFQGNSGEVVALEGINFSVKNGEFISIVGTSGCGKSTLLNMISGLTSLTSGSILLDQIPVEKPGSDRAVVFQSDANFPWLTVYENIEYGLKIKKVEPNKRATIVNELITLLGLEKFANAYPKELSGGMRKRIDIGRAYAVQPEILCMDEPFGALDVVTREQMQEELLRIWTEHQKTVIFITHDLEEAMYLSDRIILLSPRPGRIKKIIPIDFPRPRTNKLRESQQFYELRNQLRQIMG